jgi:hypothetical protein
VGLVFGHVSNYRQLHGLLVKLLLRFINELSGQLLTPSSNPDPTPRELETEMALKHIHSMIRLSASSANDILPHSAAHTLDFYANQSDASEHRSKLQRALTQRAEQSIANQITNHSDVTTSALIKARTQPLAHIWKQAIPSDPSLSLTSDQLLVNLRVEFGLPPVCVDRLTEFCGKCPFKLAEDNTHFINCAESASFRLRRHNEITNHLAEAIRSLSGYTTVEPRKLADNDNSRPDIDATIGSKRFLIDVTCRNEVSKSQRNKNIVDTANNLKTQHYSQMASTLHAQFIPFTTLAFGGFSDSALNFLRFLRKHGTARNSPDTQSTILSSLVSKIAISIHRQNAEAYLAGIKSSQKPLATAITTARGWALDFGQV